jgi:hypothetical protein
MNEYLISLANQNYTVIPSHPTQNGNHQENKQQEVLVRMPLDICGKRIKAFENWTQAR